MASKPAAVHPVTEAIEGERLTELVHTLAGFGALAEGIGIDRQALTSEDLAARRFLVDRARTAGAKPFRDPAGNFFFHWAGRSDAHPVATGSHIDSQPSGGALDGAYGICAGMEVLAALSATGYRPARPIEVVVWTNEEGCRFAPGTMGSSAFADPGLMTEYLQATDAEGTTFEEALGRLDETFSDVPRRSLGVPFSAFVEAHIEQGTLLEEAEVPVGVVERIQGARWFVYRVTGIASHAGTTTRAKKHDALAVAVAIANEIYSLLEAGDDDLRLTIGHLVVRPGSVNVVPAEAYFTVDLRHPRIEVLDSLEPELRALAEPRSGCEVRIERTMEMRPAVFDERVVRTIGESAERAGLPYIELASGAFHDALRVMQHCPTGMVFVPSIDGLSHNPNERTNDDDLIKGTRVLAEAVLTLADTRGSLPAPLP
ncbi:MAG: M20 family metallo-hydrolase [Acidimicrobiales bacterium]